MNTSRCCSALTALFRIQAPRPTHSPWSRHQPHVLKHPLSLVTQKGVVTDGWLFPSASTLSTNRRVATQRTRPSHAVCREVRKEGGTGGERHMVSSKTKGHETLGTLRREGRSPGFAAQWSGSGPFSAQTGTVLGLASPQPPPHPSSPGSITADSADPLCYPRPPEHRSVLTNLASALGLPLTALPGVFPMRLGATFLPALPTPLPPLLADALAPAQGLQKEQRRAGTTGSGVLPVLARAWDGTMQGSQNSNLK